MKIKSNVCRHLTTPSTAAKLNLVAPPLWSPGGRDKGMDPVNRNWFPMCKWSCLVGVCGMVLLAALCGTGPPAPASCRGGGRRCGGNSGQTRSRRRGAGRGRYALSWQEDHVLARASCRQESGGTQGPDRRSPEPGAGEQGRGGARNRGRCPGIAGARRTARRGSLGPPARRPDVGRHGGGGSLERLGPCRRAALDRRLQQGLDRHRG